MASRGRKGLTRQASREQQAARRRGGGARGGGGGAPRGRRGWQTAAGSTSAGAWPSCVQRRCFEKQKRCHTKSHGRRRLPGPREPSPRDGAASRAGPSHAGEDRPDTGGQARAGGGGMGGVREGERGRCQQQNGHMFPGGGPGSRARTSPRAGGRRASPALRSSLQSRPYVIAREALDRGWQQAIKPADRDSATS